MSVLLLLRTALAYEWGVGIPGNTGNYSIVVADFTALEAEAIQDGASAWNAGPSELLRGADFTWNRGEDDTNGGSANNWKNEVYARDDAWFDAHGKDADTVAFVRIGFNDRDIVFRRSANFAWCTDSVTDCPAGTISIGQVSAHEFGHRIGFNHENDTIALMNSSYPGGGDLGRDNNYRINEDDFVGLKDRKTGTSTGTNLLLTPSIRMVRTQIEVGTPLTSTTLRWVSSLGNPSLSPSV